MKSGRPSIIVVIPTFNRAADACACVQSLLEQDYREFTVLVIDNGSTDGTAGLIRDRFWDAGNVQVVEVGQNLGFAGGCNVGVAQALQTNTQFVLLLNDDAVIAPDTAQVLIEAAKEEPTAGIFVPKVYVHDGAGRLWSAGARRRRFPPMVVTVGLNRLDAPEYNRPRLLTHAPGVVWLVRREVFERVGLLDQGYFMYYEDYEFCERVRRAGFTIRYVPDGRAWHKASAGRRLSTTGRWCRLGKSSVRYYLGHGRRGWLSLAMVTPWVVVREAVTVGPSFALAYLRGVWHELRLSSVRSLERSTAGSQGGRRWS